MITVMHLFHLTARLDVLSHSYSLSRRISGSRSTDESLLLIVRGGAGRVGSEASHRLQMFFPSNPPVPPHDMLCLNRLLLTNPVLNCNNELQSPISPVYLFCPLSSSRPTLT
jgi:hypothetical protein